MSFKVAIDRTISLESQLQEAADAIRRGKLLVFPTDTVYGIGCDASNPQAANELIKVKQRPAGKPFPILVSTCEDMSRVALTIPQEAKKLIALFLPGALTLVLPARRDLPEAITGGGETVGIRIPDDEVALYLMRMSGCALIGPSANVAGDPPPSRLGDVSPTIKNAVDVLIDDGPRTNIASTVLDLTSTPPRIIREGAISREDIDRAIKMSAVRIQSLLVDRIDAET